MTQEDGGIRVRGRTTFVEVRGDWFRCRMQLPASPENLDGVTFRRSVIKVPTLMYDTVDSGRQPVVLSPEMRLEIEAPELGENQVWDVTSAPEPFRKKKRVIGWQVTLRRVEDEQIADAVDE